MYTLECLCKFRDQFNEIEGLPPFENYRAAMVRAIYEANQRRTKVRIVDDYGAVVAQFG